MFPYQKRHSAQLLEASRLTQAGQLLEATALIQQTLQGALAPDATPTTTEPSTDAPFIEGSFRVVEPETTAGEPSVRKPKPQEVELTILTLPTPTKTETASNPKQTPIYPVDPCSDAPAQQQTSHAEQIETWPNISNLPLASHLSRPLRRWKVKQSNVAPASAIGKGQYKGQFLSQTYTNEAGTRPYKLYLPNRYQGQAWPLLVLLHGCSQSPDDIAAGSRMNELAETHSFLVLYPGQISQANTSKCWNWFNASEQQRDRGEPALIAGLTRQILTTYGLDTQRVYVAGISAGGAMAMVMGTVYPDLNAAIGYQSALA
jgi:hypothetical protein